MTLLFKLIPYGAGSSNLPDIQMDVNERGRYVVSTWVDDEVLTSDQFDTLEDALLRVAGIVKADVTYRPALSMYEAREIGSGGTASRRQDAISGS